MPRSATVYDYARMCQQIQKEGGADFENWTCVLAHDLDVVGFYAAAYQHNVSGEVVLAYRGTIPTHLGNLASDYEIFMGTRPETFHSAYAFFDEVRAARPDALIAVTGFSLGAVLAELTAVEYTTIEEAIPAITFDSPGTRPLISDKHVPLLADVQVTTYMVKPNLINTCHEHIGRIFQIDVEPSPIAHGSIEATRTTAAATGGAPSVVATSLLTVEAAANTLVEHSIDKLVVAISPDAENTMYRVHRWPSWLGDISPEAVASLFRNEDALADIDRILELYRCEPVIREVALKLPGHDAILTEGVAVPAERIEPGDKFESQVDSSCFFSTDLWLVSIINTGSMLGGHAILVVEGIRDGEPFVGQYDIKAAIEEEDEDSTLSGSFGLNKKGYIARVNMRTTYRPGGYGELKKYTCNFSPRYFDDMLRSIQADFDTVELANLFGHGHPRYQLVGESGILHDLFGEDGAGINCAEWCMEKLAYLHIGLGKKARNKPTPAAATMSPLEYLGPIGAALEAYPIGGCAFLFAACMGFRNRESLSKGFEPIVNMLTKS